MTNEERDIQRKLKVLQHAEKIGNARKACRYFGVGRSSKGDICYDKFNKSGTKNDYTIIYIDTDNDRDAEMGIKLMGLHNLTADDFIL